MTRRALLADLPIDLGQKGVPIHEALYEALRGAILGGRLRPASRMPSSRDLGQQLGVARGTVVTVYERLRGEGYLVARTGSGTIVATTLPDRWFRAAQPSGEAPRGEGRSLPLSQWGQLVTRSPFALRPRRAPLPFRPHIPAVDMFPAEEWGRMVARRARRDEKILLGDGDVRGYAPLREVLGEHLRVARGVQCTAEQIVILPSVQQALDIAARLSLNPGDSIWMEDPGYIGARAVFAATGAKMIPVPVDGEGIDVAAGIQLAPEARLAYVTPGHQAPLGVTMTIERRLALLRWAGQRRALVIEDDYDSEYRYEGRPVPALQGLDRSGVVLHVGTFSKTLLPSLRLAYAVVPEGILDAFVAAKSILDRFTPSILQTALTDFIEGGHFGRHLRRMREIYAERRAVLLAALGSELGDRLTVVGASAGLGVAVTLPAGFDDRALEAALAAESVEVSSLSRHSLRPERAIHGFLLGFAPFSPVRIRRAVAALARPLRAAAGGA